MNVELRVFFDRCGNDHDNRTKPAIDALQGCALVNDSQVCYSAVERLLDYEEPRIEVLMRLKRDPARLAAMPRTVGAPRKGSALARSRRDPWAAPRARWPTCVP